MEQARAHYEQAIELYQKEQAKLGLANALKSLGDLAKQLELLADAIQLYEKAVQLYRQEQAPMGLAYTLSEILECRGKMDHLSDEELALLLEPALYAAKRSGVESVLSYVLAAFMRACDEDINRAKGIMSLLGVSIE